ncbi:MAG: tRNA pseudouridine(55) synthase TruB [Desulfobacterales bacterium]|nr:tRNA pseudouridine(55) synthase TruB [Desulfobacterales bacterium]
MQHDPDGIIVVDKPAGISSAKVVAVLKGTLKVKKAGHTGTLDPFATGVMVCCINHATKLARFLLHDTKKYEAVLCLGKETDTQDITGNITTECPVSVFAETEIRSVIEKFTGDIDQIPPIYSALKHKGTPLYKLARKGKPVVKPARRVNISGIDILDINLPEIRFEVTCSAGTYIRTLCFDIGKALGCGGHLKTLRRLECGGYSIRDAITLEELQQLNEADNWQDRLISMADAIEEMPSVIVDKVLEKNIKNGILISRADLATRSHVEDGTFVRVLNNTHDLIAVLSAVENQTNYKYCCVFHN